jgi:hypothetical protein
MGGRVDHEDVITGRVAERILTLRRPALGIDLSGVGDPGFFWYESDLPPDSIYVRFTDATRRSSCGRRHPVVSENSS